MYLITSIFQNAELAKVAFRFLEENGYLNQLKVFTRENIDELNKKIESTRSDYLLHKLDQGECIVQIETDEQDWIAAHEIVRSFSGEIFEDDEINEVYNQMYGIPDQLNDMNENGDSFYEEHLEGEKHSDDVETEIGTYGYPYDQLDDDAYIDPNIGIGSYDLLTPYYPPNDQL